MKKNVLITAILMTCLTASATVLTFDGPFSNYGYISQDYGDNVTNTTMGTYSYGGAGEGFTPDVLVEYIGVGGDGLYFWDSGYGDLVNVVENEDDGERYTSIRFEAPFGAEAVLHSIDLASFSSSPHVIDSITITNESGAVLFQTNNFTLAGSGSGHTNINFGAVSGRKLTLVLDLQTAATTSDNDSVGLDNIVFSQTGDALFPNAEAVDGDVPAILGVDGTESDPDIFIIGATNAYTRDYGSTPLILGWNGLDGGSYGSDGRSYVQLYIRNGSTVISGDDSCIGQYYNHHDRLVRLTEASSWTVNGKLSCPSSGWSNYLEIFGGSSVSCGEFKLAGGSYSGGILTVSNANSRMIISEGITGGTSTGASSLMFIHDDGLVRVDTNANTYIDNTYLDDGFFAWKGDHVSGGLTDPFYGVQGWNGSGWQDIYAFDNVGDWKCTDWPLAAGEPFYLVAYCETDAEAKTLTADPESGFAGYDGLGGYTLYTSYIPEGSNTLTVISDYGSPVPPVGTNNVANDLPVACSVEAVTVASTNWVPTGWTLSGQEPSSGMTNSFEMLSTTNAVLTWNWQTNYWLEINIEGAGSLNLPNDFYAKDSEQNLVATPQDGWSFVGWSGDASGSNESTSVTMDTPKSVTALFVNNRASTNTFGSGANEFSVEFTEVQNAGNTNDATTGYGAVGYDYRIATYETTYSQWTNFTAAAGAPVGTPSTAYNSGPSYTGADNPITGVSWYEAAQYCNWLTSGSKTNGAYVFTGSGGSTELIGVNRAAALATYGTAYVLPTRDEWYKAAYCTGSGYSDYSNGTDTRPVEGIEANYLDGYYNLTGEWAWDVGTGTLWEQNSTKDMNGNVREWTESAYDGQLDNPAENRLVFDGYYRSGSADLMRTYSVNVTPTYEGGYYGFRVAAIDSGYLGEVLTVNSAHGSPVPAVGTHTNSAGAIVPCSVDDETVDLTQYVVTGWTGTGAVPASGSTNSVEVAITEDSSITWTWQTNYWLDVSISGSGQVSSGDEWITAGSNVTLAATPDSGWLFMGWQGDASGTNSAAVTMDAPKAVLAVFSDDADGDGLLNSNETTIGSNPWKSDTDDDGFDDAFEVAQGLNVTNDSSAVVNYIGSNGDTFGLYPSNVVLDVAVGEMLLDVTGSEATLNLQLETSDDLQSWTNAGPAQVWSWTVDGEKKFFRVKSTK